MSLVLLIIILLVLFGGAGYGWQSGWAPHYYGGMGGLGGLLVIILVIWLLTGGRL